MNIIGNGVDIVDNDRIKLSLKINGFVRRIFTKNEINQSKKIKNKVNYYAKRFAAKEAFVKSIGTGFRKNINFKDIEIKNNNNGKPILKISENIKKFLKKKFNINNYKIYLSLSDEKKYSIAYVIFSKIKWLKKS